MKTAGHLISAVAELTACMEDGEYNFHGRKSRLFLDIYRNTAAVVHHCDGIVLVDGHIDGITISRQCFIYRIIYNLIHQMMETSG